MKFNADIMKNSQELTDIPEEKEVVKKKLYVRFAVQAWKVTISKDLYKELWKECTHLSFDFAKVEKGSGERLDGSPKKYKHQYVQITGRKYSEVEVEEMKKGERIKIKGTEGDPSSYYYLNLTKSQYATLDKTLISTINFVTSRKYSISEEAINYETKQVQFDCESRRKPHYEVSYKNGCSPEQIAKEKAEKEALKTAKATAKTSNTGTSKIMQTESGAHQIGR